MRKILIRFDDLCPTMDWEMWLKADKVLRDHNVKPLLGIVPDCKDPELEIMEEREDFWEYIRKLQSEGYVLAMHGYEHVYSKQYRGMVNNGLNTEFAGYSFDHQLNKIRRGKKALLEHGIVTDVFFAPSHSYDKNTIRALYECGFKYISDGKSAKPINRFGIQCIPCRCGGVPKIRKKGLYTAVFHTNMWRKREKQIAYIKLQEICSRYENDIVDFYELANAYSKGFEYFQKLDERVWVIYERYIRPILSKIKRIIIPMKRI